MFRNAPLKLRIVAALTLVTIVAPHALAQSSASQPPRAREVSASVLIRWQGQPRINRYRLQLARDKDFNDIVFDRAVVGREYLVEVLAPGHYFWRVAPAVGETGSFSLPAPVEIKGAGGSTAVAQSSAVGSPDDYTGWLTATGEVRHVAPAKLRVGAITDLVVVGSDGAVRAIDGASGIALWTSRPRPDPGAASSTPKRSSSFAPLVLQPKDGISNVVVAYDGGVRALRGDSGRELWRTKVAGRADYGVVADLGDGSPRVFVTTTGPNRMYALDPVSGRVLGEKNLEDEAVGAPFPFVAGELRGLAVALKDGKVEIRDAGGNVLKETKLKAEMTTAPVVFRREQEFLMIVGTADGLVAMNLSELKPLGRIVADNDVVRGTLQLTDLDGDGSSEVVFLTRRGRVAMVSTYDGEVKWSAAGAGDASTATLADVNRDGVLDVLVPGSSDFALGFSGRDGTLIWKIGNYPGQATSGSAEKSSLGALVLAPALDGGGMIVGSDSLRVGLRAVELPKGAVRSVAQQ